MSFSFVRRYVQRHGRSETFSSLLSTHSHNPLPSTISKLSTLRLEELDALIPPSRTPSPTTIHLQQQAKIGETVLGQNTIELLRRDPSPVPISSGETFKDLLRSSWLIRRLDQMGIAHPTSIQKLLLSKLASDPKHDLMIKAQTGTGKSFGYLIALIDRYKPKQVEAQETWESPNLILVPNSMIVNQLVDWANDIYKGSTESLIRVIVSEGDSTITMSPGYSHILVATPKGLLTGLAQGKVKIESMRNIFIDEADFLLKPLARHATLKEKMNRKKHPVPAMTALCQIRDYFESKNRAGPKVVAISATLGSRCRGLLRSAGLVQKDALFLEDLEERGQCPRKISHFHRLLSGGGPEELGSQISRIVEAQEGKRGALFMGAEQSKVHLQAWLASFGIPSSLLSEQQKQHSVEESMLRVGSDVDARGLDLVDLDFVIQANLPQSPSAYLHVAGRVGRMGRPGVVYTLLKDAKELEVFIGYLSRLGVSSSPLQD